ncbi:MAG: hypothetical protein GQ531_04270 [Sulfurovum sp.]|nr:hypothetical protein [Sulfurovum sp.]
MIKKILLNIIVLMQFIYAQNQGDEKMENILMNKPFYTLKINAVNTKIVITLNGELVFEDFDRSQKLLDLPVNQFMQSGDNTLEVKLLSFKRDNLVLHPKTEATVALEVKESGKFDIKPIKVSQISYMNGDTSNSTKDGSYPINQEEIKISKLSQQTIDGLWTGETVKGIGLKQVIQLKTPFPRWKFLDSEKIMEENYNYIDNETYAKFRKRSDIEELYKLHEQIHDAVKRKDIDWIIKLFSERNEELEIALYKPKGYYKKDLIDSFNENINDVNNELLALSKEKSYFFVSEDGKTIYLRNGLLFNDTKVGGSTTYKILFRKENGKWILTR